MKELIIQNKTGNFPLVRFLLFAIPAAIYFYGQAWGMI